MKGFAFVLLCALVAVQGRSTAVQEITRELASLGENPWLVHLRIATSTGSGNLKTCVGSLLRNNFVLTAYDCLVNSRFIWTRYGVVTVSNPSLVTANTINFLYGTLGLISLNRGVEYDDTIYPISLSGEAVPESGKLCVFGATSDGTPGETLNCYSVSLETQNGSVIVNSEEVQITEFDIGAPVVSNGVQVGVVTGAASGGNSGVVTPFADYLLDWIEERTGLDQTSEITPEDEEAPEVVKFVN